MVKEVEQGCKEVEQGLKKVQEVVENIILMGKESRCKAE